MAGKLTFKLSEVLVLAQHAIAAKERLPSFEMLNDAKYHKGGVVKCEHFGDAKNIDMSLIPPGLQLAMDHGVYLMSNGVPGMPVGQNVAYAIECDPTRSEFDDWWEAKRRIVGGDDGVDHLIGLPQEVVKAHADGFAYLQISVTARSLKMSFLKEAAISAATREKFAQPVKETKS